MIKRTNSENRDFQDLVHQLDLDLAIKNADQNSFFAHYNKIDLIKHVVLFYESGEAVGCGAIKKYADGIVEIKRMYVAAENRGNGIAGKILAELQVWAKELGYKRCILETGDRMLAAIGLYKKHGFKIIPNYGQYKDVSSSVCFEKTLK